MDVTVCLTKRLQFLDVSNTVCGPWSAQDRDALFPATFPKMIKYFVEKKNALSNERYRDLLISILSHDEGLALLLWVKTRNQSLFIIVVSRTRKSKCGAHLFVTIESYSMWSLVRVFSENDKIFRQEKKYVE